MLIQIESKALEGDVTPSQETQYTLRYNGRIAEDLCWEEMLGMLAQLTCPPRFPDYLLTPEENAERRKGWN